MLVLNTYHNLKNVAKEWRKFNKNIDVITILDFGRRELLDIYTSFPQYFTINIIIYRTYLHGKIRINSTEYVSLSEDFLNAHPLCNKYPKPPSSIEINSECIQPTDYGKISKDDCFRIMTYGHTLINSLVYRNVPISLHAHNNKQSNSFSPHPCVADLENLYIRDNDKRIFEESYLKNSQKNQANFNQEPTQARHKRWQESANKYYAKECNNNKTPPMKNFIINKVYDNEPLINGKKPEKTTMDRNIRLDLCKREYEKTKSD